MSKTNIFFSRFEGTRREKTNKYFAPKSKIKQMLMNGAIDNAEIGKIKKELNTSIEEYNPEKNSGMYFL